MVVENVDEVIMVADVDVVENLEVVVDAMRTAGVKSHAKSVSN